MYLTRANLVPKMVDPTFLPRVKDRHVHFGSRIAREHTRRL